MQLLDTIVPYLITGRQLSARFSLVYSTSYYKKYDSVYFETLVIHGK